MDKLVNTDKTGGFPLKLDDLRLILGLTSYDAGIYNALNNLLRMIGTDFIVQGCSFDSGTNTVSSGWIMLNGELLKVDEHTSSNLHYFTKQTVEKESRNYKDGSTYNVYQENRGVANGSSGTIKASDDAMDLTDSNKSNIDATKFAGNNYNTENVNVQYGDVQVTAIGNLIFLTVALGVFSGEYTTSLAISSEYRPNHRAEQRINDGTNQSYVIINKDGTLTYQNSTGEERVFFIVYRSDQSVS